MESTLEALKEVIAQARTSSNITSSTDTDKTIEREPSATELFALICSLLTSSSGMALDFFVLLDILAAVTPHTAPQVVKSQFRSLTIVILNRIKHLNENERKELTCCLRALGEIMSVQDTTIWETVYALQSANALLSYLDHAHSKVRKVAQDALVTLLSNHARKGAKQLRSYVGEFCREVLKACTRSEYKRSLYVLTLLETANSFLLPTDSVSICEIAAKIHSCEQPTLTAAAYKMLDCFFQSSFNTLTVEQTQHVLKQIVHNAPRITDMEAHTFYYSCLASALIQIYKINYGKGALLLPSIADTIAAGCDAEFTQVHCAVGAALKRIISTCIPDTLVDEAVLSKKNSIKSTPAVAALLKFIAVIEGLLQLKFQQTWLYILDTIRALFGRLHGESGLILLGPMAIRTAQLYEAIYAGNVQVSTGNQVYVFDTLGYAVRQMGVANFMSLVSFSEVKKGNVETSPFAESKDWLLNLLQNNIKLMPCKLGDFIGIILPLARKCFVVATKHEGDAVMKTRVVQLWALFPGFCYYGPPDISSAFTALIPSLDKALHDSNFPEISGSITVGLTHLIHSAKQKPRIGQHALDIEAIAAAMPTLLPSVLKFVEELENTDHRYVSCIQCIEAMASVSSYPLIAAVSKKLIELLLTSTGSKDDNDDASGWLSILLALVPYLKDNLVGIIYRTIRPLLSVKESAQKRAYLVFEALLKHHGVLIQTFESRLQILSMLSQYLLTCSVNARHMRLRCIGTLISTLEEEEEVVQACGTILGELLVCLKDANKKSRAAAVEVLDVLVNRVPLDVMEAQLRSALASDVSLVKAAAITACCVVILSRRTDRRVLRFAEDLLPVIFSVLEDEPGEMTKSVLGYLRVSVSVLSAETLSGIVPEIVDATTRFTLKSKLSSRVRAILRKLSQRVDESLLRPHMYEDDVPLLDYIYKQDRRTRRKRGATQQQSRDRIDALLGSDSESDSEDEQEEQKPRKRVKAIRASDDRDGAAAAGGLPTSLDDLLEDQTDSFMRKASISSGVATSSRKRQAHDSHAMDTGDDVPADEDIEYKVVVDDRGRVIVQKRVVPVAESKDPGQVPEEGKARQEGKKSETANTKKRAREPGEEYRSKKAGGDVWKRGQLEPHAYIPLDAKMMSKKNNRAALSQLGAVIQNRNRSMRGGPKLKSHVIVGNRKQRVAARKHAAARK